MKLCRVEVFFKASQQKRRNVSVTWLAGLRTPFPLLVATKKKSLLGSPQQAMMEEALRSGRKGKKVTIAVSLERLPLETETQISRLAIITTLVLVVSYCSF